MPVDYENNLWNTETLFPRNNCYSYAVNSPFGTYTSTIFPGVLRYDVKPEPAHMDSFITESHLSAALESDGCAPALHDESSNTFPKARDGYYLIAAFYRLTSKDSLNIPTENIKQIYIDAGFSDIVLDENDTTGKNLKACSHFCRQDPVSQGWSHKLGWRLPACTINQQASKSPLSLCTYFKGLYPNFGGFFYVPSDGLEISLNATIHMIQQEDKKALTQAGLTKDYIKHKVKYYRKYKELKDRISSSNLRDVEYEYATALRADLLSAKEPFMLEDKVRRAFFNTFKKTR